MLEAVDCRLLEVCSVRCAKSLLPEAISELAVAIPTVVWRTWFTICANDAVMLASDFIRSPNSSLRRVSICTLRSPLAMRAASSLASFRG